MTLFRCSRCKRGLRLFPFDTSTVVRRVVALAAVAPRLSLWGRAVTREVRPPSRDAPRSVSTVPLRMAEALATLAFEWALLSHVCLHRDLQTAEVGERTHSGHLWTSCHRHNEVGVGGRSLAGSWSRQLDRSCMTPWMRMFMVSSSSRMALSGIPLPRFFTNNRTQWSSGSEV